MNNLHHTSWRGEAIVYSLTAIRHALSRGQEVSLRGPGAYFLLPALVADYLNTGQRVEVLGGAAGEGEDTIEAWLRRALSAYSPADTSTKLPQPKPDPQLFGDFTVAETIGLWLRRATDPSARLLNPHLSTEGFTFTISEYFDLVERLEETRRRFARLPPVSDGLNDLNTGFFRHASFEESQESIRNYLIQFLDQGEQLRRTYVVALNDYARTTLFAGRAELRRRRTDLRKIRSLLTAVDGTDGRRLRRRLGKLLVVYRAYQQEWPAAEAPPATIIATKELAQLLDREEERIAEALTDLPRRLQSEALALSPVTVSSHERRDRLRELARQLDELTAAINEAGLYQLPVAVTDAATTPRQLKLLEQILHQLRRTERHLGEYETFYQRRRHWYSLPAHLRRVIAPLLDLDPVEWGNAFRAWYLERCLERYDGSPGTLQPEELANLAEQLRLGATHNGPVNTDGLIFKPSNANDISLLVPHGRIVIAALDDEKAHFLSVAGVRKPELVFLQHFQPVHPPTWTLGGLAQSPPTHTAWRTTGTQKWQPLDTFGWGQRESYDLYLHSDDGEGELATIWPRLIALTERLVIYHDWPSARLTAALLSDGPNDSFLAAVLIRTAEASTEIPFSRESLVDLGREVRLRFGLPEPTLHPLAEALVELLRERLPDHFFSVHLPWRDTLLPLVATAPSGTKTVLLPDGKLPGRADVAAEARRQRELRVAGFRLLAVDTYLVWENYRAEIDRLVTALAGTDRQD